MKKISVWVIVVLFGTPLAFFQGCAAEKVSIKIEKSLPQSKLAYYNDSFNNLREDLWDKKSVTITTKAAMANFKQADVRIEHGTLRVESKTSCFSRGGLDSKYALRGDFDIQLDCHIDFLAGMYGMDQMVQFIVADKTKEFKLLNMVLISLLRNEERGFDRIWSICYKNGKMHSRDWREIGNFHGTLRIVRKGNKISTLYKKVGQEGWKKLSTFRSTTNDMILAFRLQNYIKSRYSIRANSSITATFDNFRINAAQEIIEEEI